MSVVRGERRRRWLVVALAVLTLCAIPVVISALPAESSPLTADQLRRLMRGSQNQAYTGLAETNGGLGLPSLPGLTDATDLLAGKSRIRAWYESPSRWRADVITATGERDVRQTTDGTLTWDYERNLLTKVIGDTPVRLPQAADLLPPALARRLLGGVAAGDRLTRLPARRIAGVSAPGLRIVPADQGTTIGRVDLWGDPRTGVPLEVQVTARDARNPALTTRFLEIHRGVDTAALAFKPSPGTREATVNAPDLISRLSSLSMAVLPPRLAGRSGLREEAAGARAYGGTLGSFVVVPLPGRYGRRIVRTVTEMGVVAKEQPDAETYLLATPLLNGLVVRIGEEDVVLIAGTVTPAVLDQAAKELARVWGTF